MPMLLNDTGTIGTILNFGTLNITGSFTITLLMIAILFIAFGVMFRMPFEWIVIFLFPLALVMFAMDSVLMAILGVFILFMAVIIVRQLFIND
jgi:hypothetical protein